MFNDKFIIEASTNYVYRLAELERKDSTLSRYLYRHYPSLKIIKIDSDYKGSNLGLLCFQDTDSKDVAIIFQGSSDFTDWSVDNVKIFFNRDTPQYNYALDFVKDMVEKNYHITYIGGNSLGGGAAQHVGRHFPLIRCICVNAAPLTDEVIDNVESYTNIINVRDSSDRLYRTVMLDPQRYKNGYLGQTYVVNRSLYGDNKYYQSVELAHRGSILFPYTYIYKQYKVNSLAELKDSIDEVHFKKIMQLFESVSIAKFMSFDLVTSNINIKGKYDLDELQHNYGIRIKEINRSIIKYDLTNLQLDIGQDFIKINTGVNNKLKQILKYSLLKIADKQQKLYDSIYFVIEKSSDYFYKRITDSIIENISHLNTEDIAQDYRTIVDNIKIQKDIATGLIDNMITINNELYDLNDFSLKEFISKPVLKKFDYEFTPLTQNYYQLIYLPIEKSINDNILENKSFIKQVAAFINAALKAGELTLNLVSLGIETPIEGKDIKNISNLNIQELIKRGLELFKEDIISTILSDSFLFNFQDTLRTINEQLEQLLITHNNLLEYLEMSKQTNKTRRLERLIQENIEYINQYVKYNKHYLTL